MPNVNNKAIHDRLAVAAALPAAAPHHISSTATGLAVLLGVLTSVFLTLFWIGSVLSRAVEAGWTGVVSPALRILLTRIAGHGMAARVLGWGVDGGLLAVLSVAVPYVLTFYFVLALLQESGAVAIAAAHLEWVAARLGLPGAVLPLITAAGCNVPAILGLRAVRLMRERVVVGTLVTLVPCSARTAVIFGTVALFLGWPWAAALYIVVAVIITAAAVVLRRILLPRTRLPAAVHLPALRWPRPRMVIRQTWLHVQEFAVGAVPWVLGGSVVLGFLYETGLMGLPARLLAPLIEGWLRLPPAAGLTLAFAVLRKELALQLLIALAAGSSAGGGADLRSVLAPAQLFTYALVNTLAVPCTATIGMLARTVGARAATAIAMATAAVAVATGGIAARLLQLLG